MFSKLTYFKTSTWRLLWAIFPLLFSSCDLQAAEKYVLGTIHGTHVTIGAGASGHQNLSAEKEASEDSYFELLPSYDGKFSLKNRHGLYLSAHKDGFFAAYDYPSTWESFELIKTEEGLGFYFKTWHNTYLSISKEGVIRSSRTADFDEIVFLRGESSRYKRTPLDGFFAIKAGRTGPYIVTSEEKGAHLSPERLPTRIFNIVRAEYGKYRIKNIANKFVTSRADGTLVLSAESSEEAKFEIASIKGKGYTIKSSHGRYLVAREGHLTQAGDLSEHAYFQLFSLRNEAGSVGHDGPIAKRERRPLAKFNAQEGRSPDGLLMDTGPNLMVKPGKYQVDFSVNTLGGHARAALMFEVFDIHSNTVLARSKPGIYHSVYPLGEKCLIDHTVSFFLGNKTDGLRFRIWWNGKGEVEVRPVKWRRKQNLDSPPSSNMIASFLAKNPEYKRVRPLPIGEGYYGTVYLVQDSMGKQYALKLPNIRNVPERADQVSVFKKDVERADQINAFAGMSLFAPSILLDTVDSPPAVLKDFIKGPSLRSLLSQTENSLSALEREALASVFSVFEKGISAKYFVSDLHSDNLIYDQTQRRWYIIDCNAVEQKSSQEEAAFEYFKERSLGLANFRDPYDILIKQNYRSHILDRLASSLASYEPFRAAQRGDLSRLDPGQGFDPNGMDPETGSPLIYSVAPQTQIRFIQMGVDPFRVDARRGALFDNAEPVVKAFIGKLKKHYERILNLDQGKEIFPRDTVSRGFAQLGGDFLFVGLSKDADVLLRNLSGVESPLRREKIVGKHMSKINVMWLDRLCVLGIGMDQHLYVFVKSEERPSDRFERFMQRGEYKDGEWYDLGPFLSTVKQEPLIVRSFGDENYFMILWVDHAGKLWGQKALPSRETFMRLEGVPRILKENVATMEGWALSGADTPNALYRLETRDKKRVVFSLDFRNLNLVERSDLSSLLEKEGNPYLIHLAGRDGWGEALLQDDLGQVHHRWINRQDPGKSFDWLCLGTCVIDDNWIFGQSVLSRAQAFYTDGIGRWRYRPHDVVPPYAPRKEVQPDTLFIQGQDESNKKGPRYFSLESIDKLAQHLIVQGRATAEKVAASDGEASKKVNDSFEGTQYKPFFRERLRTFLAEPEDKAIDSAHDSKLSDEFSTLVIEESSVKYQDEWVSDDILIRRGVTLRLNKLKISCNTLRVETGANLEIDDLSIDANHIRLWGDIEVKSVAINSRAEISIHGRFSFAGAKISARRIYLRSTTDISGKHLSLKVVESLILGSRKVAADTIELTLPGLLDLPNQLCGFRVTMIAPLKKPELDEFVRKMIKARPNNPSLGLRILNEGVEDIEVNPEILSNISFPLTVERRDGVLKQSEAKGSSPDGPRGGVAYFGSEFPSDAEEVFQSAVPFPNGNSDMWFSRSKTGTIYRYTSRGDRSDPVYQGRSDQKGGLGINDTLDSIRYGRYGRDLKTQYYAQLLKNNARVSEGSIRSGSGRYLAVKENSSGYIELSWKYLTDASEIPDSFTVYSFNNGYAIIQHQNGQYLSSTNNKKVVTPRRYRTGIFFELQKDIGISSLFTYAQKGFLQGNFELSDHWGNFLAAGADGKVVNHLHPSANTDMFIDSRTSVLKRKLEDRVVHVKLNRDGAGTDGEASSYRLYFHRDNLVSLIDSGTGKWLCTSGDHAAESIPSTLFYIVPYDATLKRFFLQSASTDNGPTFASFGIELTSSDDEE